MTYLTFDLVVLLPVVLVLAAAPRRRRTPPGGGRDALAIVALAAMALLWTLPWDAHLIAAGIWTYPPSRVSATFGGVPLGEVVFILVEPVVLGLWLRRLPRPSRPASPPAVTGRPDHRARPALAWLLVAAVGLALATTRSGRYLGEILAWTAPPLALQSAVGGDVLHAAAARRLAGVAAPALVFCLADRLALGLGIWRIAPDTSTGLTLAGLPVEEALFFVLTSLLVVDGLVLAASPTARSRALQALPALRRVLSTRHDPVVPPVSSSPSTTTGASP